jgi:hypothetical protein
MEEDGGGSSGKNPLSLHYQYDNHNSRMGILNSPVMIYDTCSVL